MFLNDRAIIVDRMPQPTTTEEAFSLKPVPLLPANKLSNESSKTKKKESKIMELVGGEKYKIRVEVVHSNHLKFNNPDTGVLRQVPNKYIKIYHIYVCFKLV